MLSKEEIEKYKKLIDSKEYEANIVEKDLIKYIEQLETKNQNIIEKLEVKRTSAEKCYQDLIKPYYDKKLNIINTSYMSKKEKDEFINKRNCLLVQKHCYDEILEIVKGERE